MAERMIEANGVELCTEPFGEPADPPILLIMGSGGSMLWWEEGFCRMLATGGRFVIRYDHRDTGRSVTYQPGRPEYTAADLVADAAGVLDAYGISAAHVVGVSMGGALAQLLALDFPDRVLSLVLISTSLALPSDRKLPGNTDVLRRFLASAQANSSDAASVIEYLVAYSRVLAGAQRPFDEAALRDLARRDAGRARDFAAARNHELIPDDGQERRAASSVTVPVLVIHGSADPMFPIEHGEALAEEIPDARLMALQGAGHGLDRADWEAVARAIIAHTGIGDRRGASGGPAPTSAASEGAEWSARARAWVEHWGEMAMPAFQALADATAIGPGTRVLDVGCGGGEFCRLAAAHGAQVSGIDAAGAMIEIARRAAPGADLRIGAMERLPWGDDRFDVVVGFNAFQFAADIVVALAEAKRVVRPGGWVAVCNWGRQQDRELAAVFTALRELEPPSEPRPPQAEPPAIGEPGVLEDLARQAGFEPWRAGEVDVPYWAPDTATLERAFLDGAGFHSAIQHSGEEAVRKTIVDAAAPFRQPDGSYLFRNTFRYVVARA